MCPVDVTEIIYEVEVLEAPTNQVEVQTPGPQGSGGPAGTITIGTVTEIPAGNPPTVTNSGTLQNAILDFEFPESDADPTLYARSGFSTRFSEIFTSTDLGDTIDKILKITYAGPLVSFSASGQSSLREKGTAVTSSTLSASVTKRSNAIDEVRFYKDGVLVNTIGAPNPAGGTETYAWTGSFTDNVSFSTQVDDVTGGGGPTTATDSKTFTFVYPYYSDAGAAGKSASQVGALTKSIIASTATVVKTMTATAGQVFYFAYPASYGALTSILDVNNFETIGDWTLTTANITGLDASAVSYRIYEFNNAVVAGSYQYTFKR